MSTNEAVQILEKATTPDTIKENMGEGAAKDGAPQPANSQDKVSSKLEVLIRREQAAFARERQAKQREADLEARFKALSDKEAKYNEFETNKKDPKKALGLLGLSYDEITQAHLNDGELPPQVEIKKLREEIEAYKAAQKEEKTHEEQRALESAKRQAEAQESKAIEAFKGEINTYLTDNSARYELINHESEMGLVYDVIDEHYNRTLAQAQKKYQEGEISEDQVVGKVMLIKEAADKVEEHLEQKYHKARELNKIKALWGVVPKDAKQELVKETKKPQQPPRTLTNQLSASQSAPKKGLITDQERIQKAIAYAKGLRP